MSGRNNCCDLQQDTEADFKGFFIHYGTNKWFRIMTALDKNKRRAFNFQSDFIQIIPTNTV